MRFMWAIIELEKWQKYFESSPKWILSEVEVTKSLQSDLVSLDLCLKFWCKSYSRDTYFIENQIAAMMIIM